MAAGKIRSLITALVLASVGCSLESDFVRLAFAGRVTDAATGSVIAGATISLVEALTEAPVPLASATSDAEGLYGLAYPDCADAPLITAQAPGYRQLGVIVSCNEDLQTLDLSLNPE
jgi:hypothetical protein